MENIRKEWAITVVAQTHKSHCNIIGTPSELHLGNEEGEGSLEEPDGLGPFPSVMPNYCKRLEMSHIRLLKSFYFNSLSSPRRKFMSLYIDKEFEIKKSNFPKSNVADIGLRPGSWWHHHPHISSIVNLDQLSTELTVKVVRTGCGQRTGLPLLHFHFFLSCGVV